MARTLEKRSKKPEIEILPVREGVQAVDDWYPVYGLTKKGETAIVNWDIPEQYRKLKVVDKNIIINFDSIFGIESDRLNTFYLRYKDSYISKLYLITHYINYFIEFYDKDNELLMNYFYLKYLMDVKENNFKSRQHFIDTLYSMLITDSIYDKIKAIRR